MSRSSQRCAEGEANVPNTICYWMRYDPDLGCYLGYECEATRMPLEQLLHEKRVEIEQIAARNGVVRLRCLAQLPVARRPLGAILISSSKQGELQAPGFLLA